MIVAARKTELSAVEAIVVEETLGIEARRNSREGALARIEQLTRERQKLYRYASAHPLRAAMNAARVRAMGAEIEQLWEQLRRERAARRVQLERALNVTDEDEDQESDHEAGSSDAA